ncbi:MAG TPA: hypothetical protein PKE66_00920 [Pyrinomonadaceae bacterium]|nr:hypothetical protein [Pyrinomonadaceae bacterium]
MEHLVILGFAFLNLFMVLGAIDLFYFHIWKYKLHTRAESRNEHKLHMAFAFLMVPVAYFLFFQNFGGWALWAGVAAVVAALGTELLDVMSENDSRASIGGLSTAEYSLHVVLTILKIAAFAFMFASKPLEAWSLSSPALLGSYGWTGEMMAAKVMIGSFAVGILHLALLNRRVAALKCKSVSEVVDCSRLSCCAN